MSLTGSSFQVGESGSGTVNMSDLKTSAAHYVTQEPLGTEFSHVSSKKRDSKVRSRHNRAQSKPRTINEVSQHGLASS